MTFHNASRQPICCFIPTFQTERPTQLSLGKLIGCDSVVDFPCPYHRPLKRLLMHSVWKILCLKTCCMSFPVDCTLLAPLALNKVSGIKLYTRKVCVHLHLNSALFRIHGCSLTASPPVKRPVMVIALPEY